MAFPNFVAAPTYTGATYSTTHTFNLPASGISSGDLLIAFMCWDDTLWTSFDTSGWTSLKHLNSGGTGFSYAEFDIQVKVADGTENGGTIQATTSSAIIGKCYVSHIENWGGSLSDVEVSTGVNGTSTTPNPDSLTPSWGAEDTLWIAYMVGDNTDDVTAYPTNYDSLSTPTPHAEDTAGGGAGVSIAQGVRELNATSEDPGTFTRAASQTWACCTVAISPVIAATGGVASLIGSNLIGTARKRVR